MWQFCLPICPSVRQTLWQVSVSSKLFHLTLAQPPASIWVATTCPWNNFREQLQDWKKAGRPIVAEVSDTFDCCYVRIFCGKYVGSNQPRLIAVWLLASYCQMAEFRLSADLYYFDCEFMFTGTYVSTVSSTEVDGTITTKPTGRVISILLTKKKHSFSWE